MKTQIITISALGAFFTSGICAAGSFEDHFGGQEGVNAHFQGTDHRLEDRIDHLQRSDTNNNAWDARQQSQIDNNTAWDDRQEGVIRQNRGRLDEHDQRLDAGDARDQRQDASIDNAHARIGGLKQQVDSNAQSIGFLSEAHTVTDQRSINNAVRLDGAEGAIRETNSQLAITDQRTIQNASAISAAQTRAEDVNEASVSRDDKLGGRIDQQSRNSDRIESESIQRDTVIANQVNFNEQVNAAYRRQSAAQFEQHGAAIESNRQAISNERNERHQMGKDLNAGVAGALAAAAAQFDLSYYGAQLSVSGGSYRGESAVGLSVGAKATDSIFINGGVVHDSRGHQGFNAAANFKF